MSGPCERLPWDSDFVGFPVARVLGGTMTASDSRAVLEWCTNEGVRFLYFLAGEDGAAWAIAAASGFRLVNIRVDLVLDRSLARLPEAARSPGVMLREATPEDRREILPIAASAYGASRFFTDQAVPPREGR